MGRAKTPLQRVMATGQFNFVQGVEHAVNRLGGTDADLARASEDTAMLLKIAEVIMADKITLVQKAPAAPQPPQATIVAEFTATINRDDPLWRREIDKGKYSYVNPALTPQRFLLQGSGVKEEKFVDLDFSIWGRNPTTQEILTEAQRLGYTRLDRAASESSLSAQPTGPNKRPVACICAEAWKDSGGVRVVGVVVEGAYGRYLGVDGLDGGWAHGYCVFRFGARK